MSRPNIIFLMTDQLRGDCLGYAGHPDVKTPYLDTLASTGTAFDRAYSACPSCIASRAAIHTGMGQNHHGRVGRLLHSMRRQDACPSFKKLSGLSSCGAS